MNTIYVGWVSFSEIFKMQFADKLSVYGLNNICLLNADKSKVSCIIMYADDGIPSHQDKILLKIRKTLPQIPAIMVCEAPSMVRAELLKNGVDDVVSPNIHIIELYERIIRLHGRYDKGQYIKKTGPFHIDYLEREISFNGIKIPLKPREYLLLEYLITHAPNPVTRMQLLSHLWNCNHEPGTNSVEVHIWRLRQTMKQYAPDAPKIDTIRGAGYQINLKQMMPLPH